MRQYSKKQVADLFEEAVEKAEVSLFVGLKTQDTGARLNSMAQLDALGVIARQVRILLDGETP